MSDASESLKELIVEQRRLEYAVKENANIMAQLLDGNLRQIRPYILKKLKKELRDFNIHTERWK